jgi:protein tyrosine/serine phosphatase
LRIKSAAFLHAVVHNSPSWFQRALGPALCYAEMLVLDYGLARILYNNRHKISEKVWRSAQPAPHHINLAARNGVKTVVNLRGDQSFGTHWLEDRACTRSGLKLVQFTLRSRAAPTREELKTAKALFETVEYPILIHCKSGADRAGLMSVLYLYLHEGLPLDAAKRQLALRYGHVRQADTGVLDYFFECYQADNAQAPISFWDWVETRYDPAEVTRSFKAKGWANRLVNDLLHRE